MSDRARRLGTKTRDPKAPPRRAADPGREKKRADLARLEKRIDARADAGEAAKWDIGRLFDEIARRGLHQLGDARRTLERYADARFTNLGYTTLKHYRRVAVSFTRASAKAHGVHKLWLGLLYLDATPADERPAELLRMDVKLADGSTKPFSATTPDEIDAATAALVGASASSAPAALPRGASALRTRIEREVGSGVAKDAPRPIVRARVVAHAGKREARISVLDIAPDDVARVGRALVRAAKP